jgi:hypothetical protein
VSEWEYGWVVAALKNVRNIQNQERASFPVLDDLITDRYRYLQGG